MRLHPAMRATALVTVVMFTWAFHVAPAFAGPPAGGSPRRYPKLERVPHLTSQLAMSRLDPIVEHIRHSPGFAVLSHRVVDWDRGVIGISTDSEVRVAVAPMDSPADQRYLLAAFESGSEYVGVLVAEATGIGTGQPARVTFATPTGEKIAVAEASAGEWQLAPQDVAEEGTDAAGGFSYYFLCTLGCVGSAKGLWPTLCTPGCTNCLQVPNYFSCSACIVCLGILIGGCLYLCHKTRTVDGAGD